jgi:N-acetylglucosaminyldiphosphoundecaprenol N-acetyl-beta-D-mannosaminyltransferase
MDHRHPGSQGRELAEARADVLGLEISCLDFEQTIELLITAPAQGERLRVHFCALHTLIEASKDPLLLDVLNQAGIVAPDGAPLLWLGRAQGRRLQRVSGPDVMLALLDCTRGQGARHFFYGSTPGVLNDLVGSLQSKLPGVQIAGTLSPPFRPLSEAEVEEISATINAAAPDYVWVGLGSPKQDRWLARFRPLLEAPVLLAVGAAFDFHSGRLQRAPSWAQRAGLEWAFRILSEPRRLTGRYVISAARLALLLMRYNLRQWRRRPPARATHAPVMDEGEA